MLSAAVVVPLVRRADPTLVVVRRAAHLRRNPGQIAFPGGLVETADLDARATALREFEEELGIGRERVRVIERLGDVVTLALSVTIAPFLGVLEPPLEFAVDASEIQSAHEVPVQALYAPGALHEGREPVVHDGVRYDVRSWLFDHGELHVWGATARILHALVTRYPTPAALVAVSERRPLRAPGG